MSNLEKFVLNILYKLTGNTYSQWIIEKIFYLARLLLGIGTASFPFDSGEKKIFDYLKESYADNQEPLVIFDVGANKGQFLELTLRELFNFEYLIYCFEPVEFSYKELSKKYGDLDNVFLEKFGLDSIEHESKIFYDFPGSLRASKFQRDLRHMKVHFSESEIVKYLTLDKYCSDRGILTLDLLKLDVEGNELNVLKGAEVLLKKGAIKVITFEFGRAQIDSGTFFKDYYYYLLGFGMSSLFRILPNGYFKPIKKYDEKYEIFFTTNYLAIMK